MKKVILSALMAYTVISAHAQHQAVHVKPGIGAATTIKTGAIGANTTPVQEPVGAATKSIVMDAKKPIVDNVTTSPALSNFKQAIAQTSIVNTLAGGPYTVFAPTDEAFKAVPNATEFLSTSNTTPLRKVMFHHVVMGTWYTSNIQDAINRGNGKAGLKTMTGQNLTVTKENGKFMIADDKGHKGEIVFPDQAQKNGVVQVINTVLFPN